MEKEHSHHHPSPHSNISKAFWIGIILNGAFVLIEFIDGFYFNSLALLSDEERWGQFGRNFHFVSTN